MSLCPATLPDEDRTPHPASVVRRYAATGGPAEPAELFGRIASAGIRLRCDSGDLLAEVPEATIRDRGWPALDRRLERHAGSLALTVNLTRRFAAGLPPVRVAAMLAELRAEVPEILLETVGGAERLAELIASPPSGADFDLACVACCRGLAIRAIQHGRGLAGVLFGGESDAEERARRGHAGEVGVAGAGGVGAEARRAVGHCGGVT